MAFLDANSLTLTCPSCSHLHSVTVGWLRTHPGLHCQRCGDGFTIDSAELLVALDQIGAEAEALTKELESLRNRTAADRSDSA